MKGKLRKWAAVGLVICLAVGMLSVIRAGAVRAASTYYASLSTRQQSGSGLYIHQFEGTEYYFSANIENNAYTRETVELYIPAGYSVTGSGALDKMQVSVEGTNIRYTVTESGLLFCRFSVLLLYLQPAPHLIAFAQVLSSAYPP